jgi:hypothetical protein
LRGEFAETNDLAVTGFPAPGEREGTQGQVGLCEGCPS